MKYYKLFSGLVSQKHRAGVLLAIVLAGFVTVGASLIVNTFTSSETEGGTKSGAFTQVADVTASGGSAIKFGSAGVGACPVAKRVVTAAEVTARTNSGYPAGTQLYVPDGPDPWGGCFPGPASTGIPAGITLTNYTGTCTITTANFVFDAKTISNCGTLVIRANNVTIKNSKFNGSNIDVQTGSLTLMDSEADFGPDPNGQAVTGGNITATRLDFYGGHRQMWCDHCTVTDSYFHGQNISQDPTAHASAIRTENNTTYRHNTIACDIPSTPQGGGCSAPQTGYPDFGPIHSNTVDRNLIVAAQDAGVCAYGGWNSGKPYNNDPLNATNIRFTDNVMQRGIVPNASSKALTDKDRYTCGFYGPVLSFNSSRSGFVFTGNMWDDGQLWANNTTSTFYPFYDKF